MRLRQHTEYFRKEQFESAAESLDRSHDGERASSKIKEIVVYLSVRKYQFVPMERYVQIRL
jgi:hypothetical protein